MDPAMPLKYFYDDDHQFPEVQADAIIRATTYHRKNFDRAVIRFSDREHLPVRTSMSTSFQRPYLTSTSLGFLGRLPQELFSDILLMLDINSLTKCRQVNLPLRQAIDSLQEYQAISTHALDALCGLLRTGLARNVSLFNFYQALCQKNCDFCSQFAGLIFLPTWRRCCYICLVMRRTELQMESVDTIQKHFSLSTEAINELTSFKTLSGRYSTDGCVQEDRITIVPVEQAMRASQEQQQEIIRFRTDNALNFMASCALPYYDRQKRAMDYGVSCAGDQLPIDETVIRGIELRFAYMARDKAYTKEGFLKHFILCREAQLLWESSKEGSIAPPEFPQVAKDGGYSKRRK